ncbi:hypothetical protein G6F52_011827 [Rhizopus delemar]|nr:hypothetical protein G6F52_011827 [Rhizopus delemar]
MDSLQQFFDLLYMVHSLPLDVQNNIKSLLKSGHPYSTIIERVPGVKKSTISDYKRKWFPNMRPLKSGRKSEITATTKSYIRRSVITGKLKTGKDAIHMKKRLAWTNAHKDWTKDDWRRMVFSDETKVNVWGSDGVKYYWKRPDDKLRFHHLDLTVKGGGGSVMMWGCITYDGPGITIQNIRRRLKKAWFEENNFESKSVYSWSAQGPDLSPIEYIRYHLKLKLSTYETKAKGVHELWDRIEEQWATFTKDDCRKYIDSMPDRIKAVIQAKGGYTDY